MPPRAAVKPGVRHLTPEQLAERLQVELHVLVDWRKKNRGPNYIRPESDGDKASIRYPLAEVEAWEQRQLVQTGT
jgi:hypothetical protein